MDRSSTRRPLRVGLNATCFDERPSGANQRFVGIYGQLIDQNPDIDFVIFEPADCAVAQWFGPAENVTTRRTPIPAAGRLKRHVHGLRYWPRALAAEHLDLFEGFHLPLTIAPHCPTILTLHDLRPLIGSSWSIEKLAYRRFLDKALRRAAHVIAVSDTVREETLAFNPHARISRIYNGINLAPFGSVDEAELRQLQERFELRPGIILSVGHLEPRKNYPRLISAFAALPSATTDHTLVIVGNDSGERERLVALVAEHGLAGRVQILSGLSDADVRGLYQLCDLVVFPSVYEGFGIPILEAMAAGKPIVVSDLPVFREITEGRGLYVDPSDVQSIAGGISHALYSGPEQRRLVEYGKHRAAAFSFPELAGQLRLLYDRVIAGSAVRSPAGAGHSG